MTKLRAHIDWLSKCHDEAMAEDGTERDATLVAQRAAGQARILDLEDHRAELLALILTLTITLIHP